MAESIKTRPVHKDIKVLNKTVTAAEHMKNTYIRTKDQAEQTQVREQTNPVEYGEQQVTEKAEKAVKGTVYQAGKQGKKAFYAVKERYRTVKEAEDLRKNSGESSVSFSSAGEEKNYQPKEHIKNRTERQAGITRAKKGTQEGCLRNPVGDTGVCLNNKKAMQMQKSTDKAVKTWNRQERTIKTVHFSMKKMEKPFIKGTGRTVKIAGQTGHTLIKTTETQQGIRTAILTTQRTTLATKRAVTTGVHRVKTAVRATATAVKAIVTATKEIVTAILAGGWLAVLLLLIVVLFGAGLTVMGGSNSSTVTPVSAEVQAYEPLIRQYARQHGIEEYVELIKAVMMQESGGQGTDPMQASECGYNTRYPNTPNGITDPEYSIDVGIQNLAACLQAAEVESLVDMNHIKLALQGYNYGNGYIAWAKEKDGGYTYANAVEFSDMMAERNGWSSYGDKEYVSHVLRYYVFGRIPTGGGNQAMVQVALTQEGNGGETYWSWYGFTQRVEWCACFVSWCADQCGYIESGVVPKFSLCSAGMEWFESRGQFRNGSYVPAAGDIVFFDWGNDGSIDHVGIIESVIDGTVCTVEGNSGDKVVRRKYMIGTSEIYGYGIY